MWPSLLPNGNACIGMESSIQGVSIRASLRIVKTDWENLSGSVRSEGERLFPGFSANAITSLFCREASENFEDFSQASASPALYHWLTASGRRGACRIEPRV